MKNFLIILLLVFTAAVQAQVYNPSQHTALNKAIGMAQAGPVDARSMYFDVTFQKYRPYMSTTEVLTYLYLPKFREGGFDIIVNEGGNLSGGVVTGGTNYVYWFKNGTADNNLVLKGNIQTINGQSGTVVIGNADSIRNKPVDVTANRNGWMLTLDSTNQRFYLSAPPAGSSYTQGTGINIVNGVISALNTSALWNANQLRGRNISSVAPTPGQIPKWNGVEYAPSQDNTGLEDGYWSNDTLYLIADGDTTEIFISLTPVGDNWGTQTVAASELFTGVGLSSDPLDLDTTIWIATKHDIANLQLQLDTMTIEPGSSVVVRNINTTGDSLATFTDDTVNMKRLKAGANVSFSVDGSSITINSTPGSAEVNTFVLNINTDGNGTVPVESMVDYILVKPTVNLSAFRVGTLAEEEAFIPSTPVLATSDFNVLVAPFYLSASTPIYFRGVTSISDIKLIYKPIHQ